MRHQGALRSSRFLSAGEQLDRLAGVVSQGCMEEGYLRRELKEVMFVCTGGFNERDWGRFERRKL